jgi:hypothetical protein
MCTAVASDAVFTVRTYGTGPLYGPGLVHKSSHCKPRSPGQQAAGSQSADRVTSRVSTHAARFDLWIILALKFDRSS